MFACNFSFSRCLGVGIEGNTPLLSRVDEDCCGDLLDSFCKI